MTLNDDHKLVQFLRQHRPPVPPAAPNLEDRIMAALETTTWEQPSLSPPLAIRSRSSPWYLQARRWWVAGMALTVGVFAAWMGQRAWLTAQTPSPTEIAEMEQFMEQSWQGVVASSTTDVYSPFFGEVDVDASVAVTAEASLEAATEGEF
ncbi:hypothetical protein [Trichothermofontia sp.]